MKIQKRKVTKQQIKQVDRWKVIKCPAGENCTTIRLFDHQGKIIADAHVGDDVSNIILSLASGGRFCECHSVLALEKVLSTIKAKAELTPAAGCAVEGACYV